MPNLYTSKGRLTDYGLSCGYIEQKWAKPTHMHTTLWKEHGVYHVRQHCHGIGARIFWHTFRTLTEARKCFREA